MIHLPEFRTKKELYKYLVANKDTLTAQKKSVIKRADAFQHNYSFMPKNGTTIKANEPFMPETDSFGVRVVINTTNLFDGHFDTHLKKLWNKSLKENRGIMHVREHKANDYEYIISDGDDLKSFTKVFSWSELGYPEYKGNTEALVFDSIVRQKRNPFMFDQYANGWVNAHSVGMQYVKIALGINDKDFMSEYEIWEKYSPEIANIEAAEEVGFTWFVKEAKVIEGSSVPKGSNFITPTLENNKLQPLQDTASEPVKTTQGIDYNKLLKGIENIK